MKKTVVFTLALAVSGVLVLSTTAGALSFEKSINRGLKIAANPALDMTIEIAAVPKPQKPFFDDFSPSVQSDEISAVKRHIRQGNAVAANKMLLAMDQTEFNKTVMSLSAKELARFLNRLYETTKVPYLNGYTSYEYNKFIKKLHKGDKAVINHVWNELDQLSKEELVSGHSGPGVSAYGYFTYIWMMNPYDLPTHK